MIDIILKPFWKQHLCYEYLFDAITKFILFGGGAGGGKSYLGCEWILYMAIQYPGTRYFIGRVELTRLMSSTYITWGEVCEAHGLVEGRDWNLNGQYHYITLWNGSRIDLLDLKYQPRDPLYERYGSQPYTSGWIEEGGEVHFDAFDTLKSRVGRWKNKYYGIMGKILITCNPKKNWLYRIFWKPWKKGILKKAYAFVQALYTDNLATAEDYGEQLSEIENKQKRQRLKGGIWEYEDNDNVIFDYDKVQDMYTNSFVQGGERFLTADIAMQGSDLFVIIVWDGWRVIHIFTMKKCDAKEVENKIKEKAEKFKVPRSNIVYDADGLGTFLQGYLRGAKPFKNNGKARKKENYSNLRSQCYFRFAKRVNKGGVYIRPSCGHQDTIAEELGVIEEHEPDKDGKVAVIPKQLIKKALERSPDFGDALMMREYLELVPRPRVFGSNTIE